MSIEDLWMSLGQLAKFLSDVKGLAAIGQNELAGLAAGDPKGERAIVAALDAVARFWRASGQDKQAEGTERLRAAYHSKARLTEALSALDTCSDTLTQADAELPGRLRKAIVEAWANPSEAPLELCPVVRRLERYAGLDDVLGRTDAAEPDGAATEPEKPIVDLDAQLSCGAIASKFDIDPEALRKRLERYRKKHFDGFTEVVDRKPGDPKYIYKVSDVMPIIEDLKTSAKRP